MNWIGIITTVLTVVNILVCLLLIFVVLLQRPKTEGLGAAFGGDTASNIFGAQTSNVLGNLTRWLGGIFLGLCLVIAILGTVDPTRKSAVADYLNQKAAEKEAEAERIKAQEEAEKAAQQLPGAGTTEGAKVEKDPEPSAASQAKPEPTPAVPTPAGTPDAKPAAPEDSAPEAPAPAPAAPVIPPAPADAPAPTPDSQPAPDVPKAE